MKTEMIHQNREQHYHLRMQRKTNKQNSFAYAGKVPHVRQVHERQMEAQPSELQNELSIKQILPTAGILQLEQCFIRLLAYLQQTNKNTLLG